jgi:hypothetical protein
MPTSPSRVAASFTASSLSDVLDGLDALRELDSRLTSLEVSFDEHYPGVLCVAAEVDPEVVSQGESLKKAREGLAAAREIRAKVDVILKAYPDDKTAKRAVADADVMIERFKKHEEAAAKVIRTIAKKQMPPALKAYMAKAEKLISAKFADPSKLQVIPWVSPHTVHVAPVDRWSQGTQIKCLLFQAVFRVEGVSADDPDDRARTRRVELTVSEATAGTGGTRINGLQSYTTDDLKQDAAWFAASFLESLRGWPGIAGAADANKARRAVALQIGSLLGSLARRLGDSSQDAEVDPAGLNVSVSFRTDLQEEDYGQYEEEWRHKGDRLYLEPAKKLLAPYADKIKSLSANYSEKGWWSLDVNLK